MLRDRVAQTTLSEDLNQPIAISIFRRASEKLRVALRDAAEPGWREQLARDLLGSKPGNG